MIRPLLLLLLASGSASAQTTVTLCNKDGRMEICYPGSSGMVTTAPGNVFTNSAAVYCSYERGKALVIWFPRPDGMCMGEDAEP